MSKWEMVRLGDVANFNMGQSPSSKSYNDKGQGIPFFQGKTDFGLVFPTIRMHCTDPKKIAKKDDVLISVRAPVGAVNIATETCCIGRGLAAISPVVGKTNYKYIYYYLQYKENDIANMGVGSTFKAISKKNLNTIDIPLPPLEVQQQISHALDCASTLIEKRKVQIDKLYLLVKSQFIEIFGRAYDQYKLKTLPEVCRFIDYRGKTPEKSDSGIPLITAKNIKENQFSIEPQEYIPTENYDAIMTRGIPRINDVLFTTEAPLGNVCRIPPIFDKFCVGQRIITMQPNPTKITSEYLERALLTQRFQDDMWKRSSGSTVKGIRSKELAQLKIPVPPLRVQTQFANFVQQVESQKSLLQQSLTKLELNYKSLMQKCFLGEIF